MPACPLSGVTLEEKPSPAILQGQSGSPPGLSSAAASMTVVSIYRCRQLYTVAYMVALLRKTLQFTSKATAAAVMVLDAAVVASTLHVTCCLN